MADIEQEMIDVQDVAAFATDDPTCRTVPSFHQCSAVNSFYRPAFDDAGKIVLDAALKLNVELPFCNVPTLFG